MTNVSKFPISRRALGGLGLGLAATGSAHAQDMAGKTIEWIIPFGVGGGSDVWARFHLPMLQKHMPGNPTIVIRNVTGGGSINGANQFAQRTRPDGLTIMGTSGSTQFPYLMGDPRVRYDYRSWSVLMASPTGGVLYVRPELGVRGPADLAKLQAAQGLKFGSQGPTSLDVVPTLAFELMNLNVQIVFGMQGRGPGRLAFERGETPIDYQTSSAYTSQVLPLVREGKAVPLFSYGILNANGDIVRDPNFPDLPTFPEFLKAATGQDPSGPAWEAYRTLFVAGFAAQKFVVVPKETPRAVQDLYLTAFTRIFADPEYKEKRGTVIGEYDEVVGDAAEKAYAAGTVISEATREWIKEWLLRRFNHRLG